MKINFDEIKDFFSPQQVALVKGEKIFCPVCKKTMDPKNFYKTKNLKKHPSGYLPQCRTCVNMGVSDKNPETFLPILKEIDVPYVPREWRGLLAKKEIGDASILGRYVAKMRLNQYRKYGWKDSKILSEFDYENLVEALQQEEAKTVSEAEKEAEMYYYTFEDLKPKATSESFKIKHKSDFSNEAIEPQEKESPIEETPQSNEEGFSKEDLKYLTNSWGVEYNIKDFLSLEQLFQDMKKAYVIQDPIAISNARMICKMTLKMNKFLDVDDVESVAKLSRQLDLFIKSANLAPVQQKDRQSSTFAISQLAYLIEKEGGFIPEWDTTKPKDNVDMILQDMQRYTEFLVRHEPNLDAMLQNTEEILQADKRPETQIENYEDFFDLEAELVGDINKVEESQVEIKN